MKCTEVEHIARILGPSHEDNETFRERAVRLANARRRVLQFVVENCNCCDHNEGCDCACSCHYIEGQI